MKLAARDINIQAAGSGTAALISAAPLAEPAVFP
jgi:hypothetical protein